jgi:hypothetical protein
MFRPAPEESVMTAVDAGIRLQQLAVERLEAAETGLGENHTYMAELMEDIHESRAAYIGLAVTEIATFRGQLFGPQVG